MKFKLHQLALCVSLALTSLAQAAEPTQRVIVQFKDNLAPVTVSQTLTPGHNRQHFSGVRSEVAGHVQRLERKHGFLSHHAFSNTVRGFSATVTAAQLAQLQRDDQVLRVEPDVPIKAVGQGIPNGVYYAGATASPAAKAGDGLDNATGLANVRAFVMDTGVFPHADLNLLDSVNFVGDNIGGDCNGHGTHVAGTIGAKDDANYVVGMAPGVGLISVKVLDCTGSGYASNLLKALDYMTATAQANPAVRYVANASVGFPTGTVITALDDAMKRAVSAGVLMVVAAGNSADNTCGTALVNLSSGTAGTGVMAVGAVDNAAAEAAFSSYGSCVALWAPGVSVTSTFNNGGLATGSGTSMAAPHVAGAALVARAVNPDFSPAQTDLYLKGLGQSYNTFSKDGRLITRVDISKIATGSAPVFSGASVTPATGLAFPETTVGQSSPEQTVTLTNLFYSTDWTASAVTSSNPQYVVTAQNCSTTVVAHNGGTCTVTVKYSPTVAGASTGQFITVARPTSAGGNVTIPVSGTALAAPKLATLPAAPSFGGVSLTPSQGLAFLETVPGNVTEPQTLTVKNTYNSPATITAVASADPTQFEVVSQNCTAAPLAKAGGTCTVAVRFKPIAAGTFSARLNFTRTSGGGNFYANMAGIGKGTVPTAPSYTGAQLIPTVLSFPDTAKGSMSAEQLIIVKNTTTGTSWTVNSVRTNMLSYKVLGHDCGLLAPQATCRIRVAFAPTLVQPLKGVFYINRTLGTTTSDMQVQATGTGLASAVGAVSILAEPGMVMMPATGVGSLSNKVAVTLTNSSTKPLALFRIGSASAEFLTATNCPSTLEVGSKCQVEVQFKPVQGGTRSAMLDIEHNGMGGVSSLQMSGTGTVAP